MQLLFFIANYFASLPQTNIKGIVFGKWLKISISYLVPEVLTNMWIPQNMKQLTTKRFTLWL